MKDYILDTIYGRMMLSDINHSENKYTSKQIKGFKKANRIYEEKFKRKTRFRILTREEVEYLEASSVILPVNKRHIISIRDNMFFILQAYEQQNKNDSLISFINSIRNISIIPLVNNIKNIDDLTVTFKKGNIDLVMIKKPINRYCNVYRNNLAIIARSNDSLIKFNGKQADYSVRLTDDNILRYIIKGY